MRLPFAMVVQRAGHWVEVSERGSFDPRVLAELRHAMATYIDHVATHEGYQTEGALGLLANDYLLGRLQQRIACEQRRHDQHEAGTHG